MKQDTPDQHGIERQTTDRWPQYFVSSEFDDVPAYYRVDGPNGPAWNLSDLRDQPVSVSMYTVITEVIHGDSRKLGVEETPFTESSNESQRSIERSILELVNKGPMSINHVNGYVAGKHGVDIKKPQGAMRDIRLSDEIHFDMNFDVCRSDCADRMLPESGDTNNE